MTIKIITVDKLPVFGPSSVAVEADGFIFISGQIPIEPATGEMIQDVKKGARQVLTNIQTILQTAGLKMTDIVKTTIFLKKMADFTSVNEIYAEFFPQEP